jgi:methionyl-tRNA synthetase
VNSVLRLVIDDYVGVVPRWSEDYGFVKETNDLLTRYIQEMGGVELRSGLSTALQISQCGDAFLSSDLNRQDRASVVGLTATWHTLLPLFWLLTCPIWRQLLTPSPRHAPLPLPESWRADSIKMGHRIGALEDLFLWIGSVRAKEASVGNSPGRGCGGLLFAFNRV